MEDDLLEGKAAPEKKSILTNPTLMGWLSIVGFFLGLYGLYLTLAFNKEVKPAYKVLSDVIITESKMSSKIKVSYDGFEVPNVRAATVAFWNAGNEFLDKGAFSHDKPLSIRSKVPVQILETQLLASTRPDLKFKMEYISIIDRILEGEKISKQFEKGTNSFFEFQIEGDEGLEANDGATFLILYTSKTKGDWYVDARVKGIPSGIEQAVEPYRRFGILDIILTITLLFGAILVIYTARRKEASRFGRLVATVTAIMLLSGFLGQALLAYQALMALTPPNVLIK